MLRVFLTLIDGVTLRHLAQRIILTVVGAVALLIGLGFMLSAGFQAVAAALGSLDTTLIFGTAFVLIAVGLISFAGIAWRSRPKPLLAIARYGVVSEGLRLAQTLIRKEPSKTVIAALILGAITEYTQKRSPTKRD